MVTGVKNKGDNTVVNQNMGEAAVRSHTCALSKGDTEHAAQPDVKTSTRGGQRNASELKTPAVSSPHTHTHGSHRPTPTETPYQSHICDLPTACGNAGSLTHSVRPGVEPAFSRT